MQPDLNGTTRQPRQPENKQRLAAALDASEFAQIERTVMWGRAPHLDYQLESGVCARDCPDCAHRDLTRRYQRAARDRVRGQSIPRLPAGYGDDVRAIIRADRAALANARAMYQDAQQFGTPRKMIDAACEYEFCERVYESHRLTQMTRIYADVNAEFDAKATLQARLFQRDIDKAHNVVRHYRRRPTHRDWSPQ